MAHKVFTNNDSELTIKNLFKGYKNIYNGLDLREASILELEETIESVSKIEEKNVKHAKEIAAYRNPIRKKRGESILPDDKTWLWNNFVDDYGNREIPFNFEIESVLKYLVYLHEGNFTPKEIAAKFASELGDLRFPSNMFTLAYINNFSDLKNPSFYDLVIEELEKNKEQSKDETTKKVKEVLLSKNIKEEEAEILSHARIGKLYENGHETAEMLLFPNGYSEGIDGHGNWIFIHELENNGVKYAILFKARKDESSRFIINKTNKIALVTNETGSSKEKVSYTYSIESMPLTSIEDLTTQLEGIITDIALVDITHDKAYELAREMDELRSISEDTNELMCESILNEEFKELKKN